MFHLHIGNNDKTRPVHRKRVSVIWQQTSFPQSLGMWACSLSSTRTTPASNPIAVGVYVPTGLMRMRSWINRLLITLPKHSLGRTLSQSPSSPLLMRTPLLPPSPTQGLGRFLGNCGASHPFWEQIWPHVQSLLPVSAVSVLWTQTEVPLCPPSVRYFPSCRGTRQLGTPAAAR